MAEIITADHGKESGHWYKHNGSPAYTIIGKNGTERPTTLRDARMLNLVPSVSGIIVLANRPGLDNWKIDQAILSALTLPRLNEEPEAAYLSRIKEDAKAQAKKAAERGTLIHAWVQKGFEGKYEPVRQTMIDLEDERLKFYDSARKTLDAECGCQNSWICEKSFATERYGGKCDLHNDLYLIDIKTTDKDLATIKTWDEHAMQLAAYDYGLDWDVPLRHRKCGILYIHKDTAESRLLWIESKELEKGWKMFSALLDYWYAKSGLIISLDNQPEGA